LTDDGEEKGPGACWQSRPSASRPRWPPSMINFWGFVKRSAIRYSALAMKVGEGVELVAHASGVMPGLAEFAAAANVGDGENYGRIEEA